MAQTAIEETMRIGELAERSGRTIRTLHFYEELGLLVPSARTKGGFRLYDPHALVRIHWISRLQELGFSLPEIKEFLLQIQARSDAPAMMEGLRRFYGEKLQESRAQIARLSALEGELKTALDYLATCRSCAPATGKSACPACNEGDHSGREAPPMVAAVQLTPLPSE